MEEKGHCKHGEFILSEGCPQCIAEGRSEGIPLGAEPFIVKVKYFSETTGELSAREYTYYSADRLSVDDIVIVPVRDSTTKAKISAVDVPEAEIEAFKDKVKTIPSGSVVETDKTVVKDGESFTAKHTLTPEMIEREEPAPPDSISKNKDGTALPEEPGADVEVMGYYEEAQKLQQYAESRVITTIEDAKLATDDLLIISRLKKAMEAKRKGFVVPLQDEVKKINETYKTLMQPIEEADRVTQTKILEYQKEQERIRKEQEEVNRLRLEAAQKEMGLKGEITESVNLVEVAPETPKSIHTDMGTAGQRDVWKYEVTDFSLLPDEYKVADTAMLNAIAKKHHDQKQILGVRFYNEPIIARRTR